MKPHERLALIKEFEEYLNSNETIFKKEVPFTHIIQTKRRFRADYVIYNRLRDYSVIEEIYFFLKPQVIIEINGGQWNMGRHNRGGKGYENDLEKSNIANKAGFTYYQFTYEMLARKTYKQYI